ncbi:MAG: Spy/CpxP family protein refolding chaperone [Gemmatimonadota bacterium]|nr:Spy/CpxP family protein refolding chaperone [Gemmatimonadota bacterium]
MDSVLAEPPRLAPGVAALALNHAAELALADSQQVLLASIRRAQDSANRPWIERLEALRPSRHPANPFDLSPEQQEEIAARRLAIAEVMEAMRETNTTARERAMALLSPEQQQKATELEDKAVKWARENGGPNIFDEETRRLPANGGAGESSAGMARKP